MVVQKNGNIVITDGYWNSRMIWFSPEDIERSMARWTQVYKDVFR